MTPAHKGSKVPSPGQALLDAAFCRALLGILLRNDGKAISFTQADFDSVVGLVVMEGYTEGSADFLIALGYPEGHQA
jgi:hypothetical protein